MTIHTLSLGAAVAPTVVSTFISHVSTPESVSVGPIDDLIHARVSINRIALTVPPS